MNTKTSSLIGRSMYISRMSYSGAKLAAAAFQSIGIDAQPSPASDARTLELGSKYLNGDECLPERITLGNFLKIIKDPGFNPTETAFLLPTAGGPCRFDQYQGILKKILKEKGFDDAEVVSPTSSNGYEGFGDSAQEMIRTFWHAVIASDIIRKMHLKYRPYVTNRDHANQLFHRSLEELGAILATPKLKPKQRLFRLRQALISARNRYRCIPAKFTRDKPLIGIVGEIYCRLNEFSNEYLINKIEKFRGEVWMSDVAEWAWYTNDEQRWRLIRAGKRFSKEMLVAKVNYHRQRRWLDILALKGALLGLVDYFMFCCACSSFLSFFSCHLTYLRICSSFKPMVLTQYPRDHKWRPQ